MKRQLSRLEAEYILSAVASAKPPLEISLLPNQLKPEGSAFGKAVPFAVCRPQFYACKPTAMTFFFDNAFLKESGMPQNVPCRFSFFYKARRICFLAAISSIEGKSFCRADALFYGEEESPFLPSASGKIFFNGNAPPSALSLRVHKDFPLDTADRNGRAASFFKFAKSSSGQAAFRELEAVNADALGSASGILFFLDHESALACLSLDGAGNIELAKKLKSLKKSPQDVTFLLEFSLRKIEAECKAVFSLFRGSLLLCSLAFAELAPENVRFLYEMSHGEKYS